MKELVAQAEENDNVNTIYVVDDNNIYYGAIDLKDLIVARDYQKLEDIISTSYPYVYAHEKMSECIEDLKDYSEDSIPVLNKDKEIIGAITSSDIIEAVDEEMSDDYAKLAGLTEENDLTEGLFASMKKRLPWLILLLLLGMGVSSVVGIFENVGLRTYIGVSPLMNDIPHLRSYSSTYFFTMFSCPGCFGTYKTNFSIYNI